MVQPVHINHQPMNQPVSRTKPTCLICQKTITGRSDKKFCTAKCRSAFHNKRSRFKRYLDTTYGEIGLKKAVRKPNDDLPENPYINDRDYQRYKHGEITKTDWWDIKDWGYYFCEPLDD